MPIAGKAGIGLTENELEMVSGGAIKGSSEYDDNSFKDDNGGIYEDMVGEFCPPWDAWTDPFSDPRTRAMKRMPLRMPSSEAFRTLR